MTSSPGAEGDSTRGGFAGLRGGARRIRERRKCSRAALRPGVGAVCDCAGSGRASSPGCCAGASVGRAGCCAGRSSSAVRVRTPRGKPEEQPGASVGPLRRPVGKRLEPEGWQRRRGGVVRRERAAGRGSAVRAAMAVKVARRRPGSPAAGLCSLLRNTSFFLPRWDI